MAFKWYGAPHPPVNHSPFAVFDSYCISAFKIKGLIQYEWIYDFKFRIDVSLFFLDLYCCVPFFERLGRFKAHRVYPGISRHVAISVAGFCVF